MVPAARPLRLTSHGDPVPVADATDQPPPGRQAAGEGREQRVLLTASQDAFQGLLRRQGGNKPVDVGLQRGGVEV